MTERNSQQRKENKGVNRNELMQVTVLQRNNRRSKENRLTVIKRNNQQRKENKGKIYIYE